MLGKEWVERRGLEDMELTEETEVIFEEKTDVVNPELQHGYSLYPHAKGKAGKGFWVVSYHLKDLRVNHT